MSRRISGTGEPGGLLSMGSHRVWHDWSDLAAAADKIRVSAGPQMVGLWSLRASLVPLMLPHVISWLLLLWLATVRICLLEFREDWSLAYNKWGIRRLPCPGAPQDPSWFHVNSFLFPQSQLFKMYLVHGYRLYHLFLSLDAMFYQIQHTPSFFNMTLASGSFFSLLISLLLFSVVVVFSC